MCQYIKQSPLCLGEQGKLLVKILQNLFVELVLVTVLQLLLYKFPMQSTEIDVEMKGKMERERVTRLLSSDLN